MSQDMPYLPPPPGGGSPAGGPTRLWYWLGGGIVVAGILGAVLWFVVGIGL